MRIRVSTSRRRLVQVLAAGVVASGLACGYTLAGGSGLTTSAAGRAVVVGPIENRSFEADAALLLQRALGRELGLRGAGTGRDEAVLVGRVESVQAVPVGVVGPQDVRIWRVDVRASVELREGTSEGRRLAGAVMTGSEDYRAGLDIEGTEASRRLALQRLLERLAADGLDRLAP
jgi:hypothetical protein